MQDEEQRREGPVMDVQADSTYERVIRPAALLPERAAREILAWLQQRDVSAGGCWSSAVGSVQRYSGPFDGPSGTRGSSVLLGSLYITWDTYEATIYRVSITEAGAEAGLTVDALCDEMLRIADLTLASCPRANLLAAPMPDPFRRAMPAPRAEG
jgi:hypothetical protein